MQTENSVYEKRVIKKLRNWRRFEGHYTAEMHLLFEVGDKSKSDGRMTQNVSISTGTGRGQ